MHQTLCHRVGVRSVAQPCPILERSSERCGARARPCLISSLLTAMSPRRRRTAVPAAGVIGEAMLAIVLADAMREKFGGDTVEEMRRNFDAYMADVSKYISVP